MSPKVETIIDVSQIDFDRKLRAHFIFYIYDFFAANSDKVYLLKRMLENLCKFENVMGLQFLLTLDESNKLQRHKQLLFRTISTKSANNSQMIEVLNAHFQNRNVDLKTVTADQFLKNANIMKKSFKGNDVD
eukprot:Awhi_evm1s6988